MLDSKLVSFRLDHSRLSWLNRELYMLRVARVESFYLVTLSVTVFCDNTLNTCTRIQTAFVSINRTRSETFVHVCYTYYLLSSSLLRVLRSRNPMTSRFPLSLANWRAVLSLMSVMFGSQPRSISICEVVMWPLMAAHISGVMYVDCILWSTSQPVTKITSNTGIVSEWSSHEHDTFINISIIETCLPGCLVHIGTTKCA